MVQNFLSCRHNPCPLHQKPQQFIFLIGQFAEHTAHIHGMSFPVQNDLPDGQGFLPLLLPAPAQQRPHSGDQLHHAKGLRDIIVRPHIKSPHLVKLRCLGRDKDDRHLPGPRVLAQLLRHRQTTLIGQHNIQQHQARHPLPHRPVEIRTVLIHLHIVAAVFQRETLDLADIPVVLHHIDQSHVQTPRYLCSLTFFIDYHIFAVKVHTPFAALSFILNACYGSTYSCLSPSYSVRNCSSSRLFSRLSML